MPCGTAIIQPPEGDEQPGDGGGGELSPIDMWNNLTFEQKAMVGGGVAAAGLLLMRPGGGGGTRFIPPSYTNRTIERDRR